MEIWGVILLVVGILALSEGLLITLFTKQIIKITKQFIKNLKKIGIIEIILAIIAIGIAYFLGQ